MQASRSYPCLKGFFDVSPYEKSLGYPIIAPNLALLDHNYNGWSSFTLQNGCNFMRRNSLPIHEFPFIRNGYQVASQVNPVVYLDHTGRPTLHRHIRRRFMPYEMPTDKALPELPVEEVERILHEIECGAYSNTNKLKRPDKKGTPLHSWRSMPHYTIKRIPSQMASSNQVMERPSPSPTTNPLGTNSDDFNFEVVDF